MPLTVDQRIAQFHRSTIQQMRRVGLSAYVLKEDGSVIRFKSDGKRELIVSASAIAASVKPASDAMLKAGD